LLKYTVTVIKLTTRTHADIFLIIAFPSFARIIGHLGEYAIYPLCRAVDIRLAADLSIREKFG
jgi:hypothetical protein